MLAFTERLVNGPYHFRCIFCRNHNITYFPPGTSSLWCVHQRQCAYYSCFLIHPLWKRQFFWLNLDQNMRDRSRSLAGTRDAGRSVRLLFAANWLMIAEACGFTEMGLEIIVRQPDVRHHQAQWILYRGNQDSSSFLLSPLKEVTRSRKINIVWVFFLNNVMHSHMMMNKTKFVSRCCV